MINLSRRKALTLAAAAALAPAASSAFAETAEKKGTKDMPMRNQKYALTRAECLKVIEHTDHAVLSTADSTGDPYGVPVTPFMYNGKIYFHGVGAGIGRRTANLTQNPRASMCWIAKGDTNEPELDVDYVSVIVSGPIRIVQDPKEKVELMRLMLARHTPSINVDKAIADRVKKIEMLTNVYELTPGHMTGKGTGSAYVSYFGHKRPETK